MSVRIHERILLFFLSAFRMAKHVSFFFLPYTVKRCSI